MEIRLKDIQLDFDSETRKIGGYINVVERESETLYSQKRNKWFKETIKSGCFTRALQKNDSIPLLLEHDWDKEVAHTQKGTLELREDQIGLRFDALIDEDTYKEIENRKISSCSFGFKVNDADYEDVNSKFEKRYISNIDLFEVSLVSNPAYVGSLVEQRNLESALQETVIEEVIVEDKVEDVIVEEVETEVVETETITEEVVVEEERTIDVDVTSSDIKEDAKEVIQDVIEDAQRDAEFYGSVAQDIENYKEEVIQETKETVENLENESLYYTTLAYSKWLEVAKLKNLKMNL